MNWNPGNVAKTSGDCIESYPVTRKLSWIIFGNGIGYPDSFFDLLEIKINYTDARYFSRLFGQATIVLSSWLRSGAKHQTLPLSLVMSRFEDRNIKRVAT